MNKSSNIFSLEGLWLTLSFVSFKTWKQGKTLPALAVAMLLFALPGAATAQNNFNGFGWTQVGNTISITSYTGAGGAVVIPDTINSLPVTIIGNDAFLFCSSLTNITVPASVITIDSDAFSQCTNLTSITIPAGVTTIESFAFYICPKVTSLTLGPNVTTIGTAAFAYCALTNVTIPSSVTNIGTQVFYSPSLAAISVDAQNAFYSSVNGVLFDKSQSTLVDYPGGKIGAAYTIPASVTNIEAEAFSSCYGLTTITIPYGVASIGENTFNSCTNLINVTIPASVTDIGSEAFEHTGLRSIAIPNSVTNIEDYAFGLCGNLTSVTLGTGVTNIGYRAFQFCSSLANITIPASVANIGDEAFRFCSSLSNVCFEGSPPNYGEDVFLSDPVTVISYISGMPTWGTTYDSIPTAPCAECGPAPVGALQVNLGPADAVRAGAQWQVDGGTFQNSGAVVTNLSAGNHTVMFNIVAGWVAPASQIVLVSVNITNTASGTYTTPNPFNGFGWEQVGNTISITSYTGAGGAIVIPDTINGLPVTDIVAFALYANVDLTGVTFGTNVTTIEESAFGFCPGLSNVIIPSGVTNIGDDAFQFCASLAAINVDAQNAFYSSVNGVLFDKSQRTLIEYPAGKTGAAYTIPASVTNIEDFAFGGCYDLTTVIIPNGIASIEANTFYYCTNLVNVTIPASVTDIAGGAFENTGLRSITIPGSVTDIKESAFVSCGSLASVTLGTSVTNIGAEAFYGCNLTTVTIPASVTYIGDHAFGFCSSLNNVCFEGSPPNYRLDMFFEDPVAVISYISGMPGWGTTYDSIPTAPCAECGGTLQVTITPTNAVSAGAEWQVDGSAWEPSGTVTNLPAGSHTIEFLNIAGWNTPSNQIVNLTNGLLTTVAGNYTLVVGALRVNLGPGSAVSAGAQWQVDGGAFLASGTVVTNLLAGSHTIAFKNISGWSTPSAQSTLVSFGVTNVVSGTYIADPGAIQVNLSPSAAVSAGAQWQMDGGTFRDSGVILGNVSPGSHSLSFKTIPGWITPANQNLNIISDVTNISSGVYGLLPGATTLPPGNFNGATVTLNASVSPNGFPTTVYYNYGPDSMCTNFVSASVMLSNNLNANQAVPIVVTGLLPGPTYRVQVVASNSLGIILGSVVTFSWPGPLDTGPNDARTVTWNRAALGQAISGFCCASGPQAVNYTWPNNNNWSQAFQFATDPCGDQVVSQPSNWGTNNPPNGTNYNVIVGSQGGAPVNLDIAVTVNSFVLQAGGGLNISQQQLAAKNFDFQGDFNITTPGNGRLLVLSGGKLMKSSGTNSLAFDPSINLSANNATLEADAGTLILPGASSVYSNCVFNAAKGATLQFMPTNQSVQATLAGVSSGAGGGLVLFNSGQLNADPGGSTLNFPGPLFVWTGGSIAVGSATLTNLGVINIQGTNGPQVIQAGTFLNQGTMENLDTNALLVNGIFTVFVNDANGIYDLAADGGISGTGTFYNYGLLRKSGGTNTSTVGVLLDNRGGTIDVESGNLVLAGSDRTSSNGTVHVNTNATLDLTGGRNVTWAGTLTGTGAGYVLLSSGRFESSGEVSFDLAGSLFLWTGGIVDLGGGSATNLGVINLKGSNAPEVLGAGGFYNAGLMANLDTNSLTIASFGGSIENLSGGTYDFVTDGGIAGFGHFYNDGLVRKEGGTNTSVISPTFVNQGGSIEVDRGTLSLSGPFDQAGGTMTFRLNGLAQGQSGQLLDNNSITLGGTLRVSFADTFAPPIGTQFQLVSGSSCSGIFSAINVPAGTMVTYSSTGVFLVVTSAVPVHILSPQIVGTNFLFQIQTINGQSYTVQKSDDLNPPNWAFYSNFTGSGGPYEFITPATNVARRFFRVREP